METIWTNTWSHMKVWQNETGCQKNMVKYSCWNVFYRPVCAMATLSRGETDPPHLPWPSQQCSVQPSPSQQVFVAWGIPGSQNGKYGWIASQMMNPENDKLGWVYWEVCQEHPGTHTHSWSNTMHTTDYKSLAGYKLKWLFSLCCQRCFQNLAEDQKTPSAKAPDQFWK